MSAWLWAGGGIVGAGLILWFGSRVFGWKIAAIAAGVFLAAGQFLAAMSRARQQGRDEQRARQDRANQDAINRANAAREGERARQERTHGAIDENDPYLRDD